MGDFDTLNKEKVARDKLACWRQVKDVPSSNKGFQKILLDIPNISKKGQVDYYTRGLKSYIWKKLYTKDYNELSEEMGDAEKVKEAHCRVGTRTVPVLNGARRSSVDQRSVSMKVGDIQLSKPSLAERYQCMKKRLCLRCCQEGQLANDCQMERETNWNHRYRRQLFRNPIRPCYTKINVKHLIYTIRNWIITSFCTYTKKAC